MKENTKWLLFNLTVAFSLYWAGNLLLWFPWSINANLGIGLMLTIMPMLWGIGIASCLIRYNGEKLLTGVIINSIIMLVSAIVSDYIFFWINSWSNGRFVSTCHFLWIWIFDNDAIFSISIFQKVNYQKKMSFNS